MERYIGSSMITVEQEGRKIDIEKHGVKPRALFVSGIHGDECEVIPYLRAAINTCAASGALSEYAVIFEAYPETVEDKTRKWRDGTDGNRIFNALNPEPVEPQAALLHRALTILPQLSALFSFHMHVSDEGDPRTPFYFYYAPRYQGQDEYLRVQTLREKLNFALREQGFATYTGLDAEDLGHEVVDGYVYTPADMEDDGSFETYALYRGLKSAFTFEVLPDDNMMSIIFQEFILPFLGLE